MLGCWGGGQPPAPSTSCAALRTAGLAPPAACGAAWAQPQHPPVSPAGARRVPPHGGGPGAVLGAAGHRWGGTGHSALLCQERGMDGQRAWEHSREAQHWRHGGENRRHPDRGGVRGSRMPQGPGRSFDTALAAAFRLLCWTTQSLCFVCTQMAESPPPPPSSGVPAPHRGQSPGCQDGTPVPAPHTGQEGCSAPPTPLSAVEMLPGQCGEGLDWARPPQA